MTLHAAFDAYEFNRYDYGAQINFKIYKQDRKTAFNATGYSVTLKCFKRHGDRAFYWRDVERALTIIGEMAQVISDIAGAWDTQASGIGHVAFTQTLRPSIPGYMWLVLQLTKAGETESTKPVRVYVNPSEAQ